MGSGPIDIGSSDDPRGDCKEGSDSSDTECAGDMDIKTVSADCDGLEFYVVKVELYDSLVETGPDEFTRRATWTLSDAEIAGQSVTLTAIQRPGEIWSIEEVPDEENPLDGFEALEFSPDGLTFTIRKQRVPFQATHASAATRTSTGPGTTIIDKLEVFEISR